MKNVVFLALALWIGCLAAYADDEPADAIILRFKDSSEITVYLYERPVITIGDKLEIATLMRKLSFDMATLKNYNFVHTGAAVSEIAAEGVVCDNDGSSLRVSAADVSIRLTLADLHGIKMLERVIAPHESVTVDLSRYTPGVYILNTNGASAKIIVK